VSEGARLRPDPPGGGAPIAGAPTGGAPDGPAAGADGDGLRRRLHPLSPLLNSAKLLAGLIAVISIQGFAQLGWRGGIGVVIIAAVGAMAFSAVSWLVTGYHVLGRELRIYDGVLVRRTRAIPLERLQSVEVVRPLVARAAGLAELRLEVVGGGRTEAPLAFLTEPDAVALRERLLALAGRGTAPAADARPGAPGTPGASGTASSAAPTPALAPAPLAQTEHPLHRVVNRDVVISQLLTPQMMFLPFGVALVAVQTLFRTAVNLVVMLSLIVAVIGVVQQPVRRILSDWNFRLALQDPAAGRRDRGLRVRHGLTETRSQTVPLHRIQALRVTWPLLWRRRAWLHCQLHVAGIEATPQASTESSGQLLPVGDRATAERLAEAVMPGLDLAGLPLTAPPARARWVAPIRRPVLGAAVGDQVFASRDGRITRRLVVVPYARIQSVRVVQGPVQRRLRLATVFVDAAGSLTAAAHHRDLSDARGLAAALTERARAARDDHAPGDRPPPGAAATTSWR
jgi:putative membrane protein